MRDNPAIPADPGLHGLAFVLQQRLRCFLQTLRCPARLNRHIVMRYLVLLTCLSIGAFAGCTTSSGSQNADTESIPYWIRFEDAVDHDYFVTVPPDAELPSVSRPGVRFVKTDDPEWSMEAMNQSIREDQPQLQRQAASASCPKSGTVYVSFILDRAGRIVEPQPISSVHPECDAQAVAMASALTLAPPTYGGEPASVLVTLPVKYK